MGSARASRASDRALAVGNQTSGGMTDDVHVRVADGSEQPFGDAVALLEVGLQLGDELTMHYGLLPRANRGIFAINELPDLAGKIQVEGDMQLAMQLALAVLARETTALSVPVLVAALELARADPVAPAFGVRRVRIAVLAAVLVNSAAGFEARSLERTDADAFDAQSNLNARGPLLLTRALLPPLRRAATPLRVAAYDFGIKLNILRRLAAHGCAVRVFPATAPAASDHVPVT